MPLARSRSKPTAYLFFATALSLPAAVPEITINLYDRTGIEAQQMGGVRRAAGESLKQAGILVRWRTCRGAGDSACGEDDVTHFVVALLPEHMSRKIASNPKQCGLAATSGPGSFPSHAYIFYDRVVDLARNERVPWSLLLGATIAHEVGHLLLGDNSHFPVGIMRAEWLPEEIKQALMGVLTFTPKQAEQVRRDVFRRMASCASQCCQGATKSTVQ